MLGTFDGSISYITQKSAEPQNLSAAYLLYYPSVLVSLKQKLMPHLAKTIG